MKCELEFTGETNQAGWRMTHCVRPGCKLRVGWTPDPIEKIHADNCRAWPRWYEVRGWTELMLAVVGLNPRMWHAIRLSLGLVVPDVSSLGDGPGTEMALMLATLGAQLGPACSGRAKQMNDWGIDGCREHREEITGWLKEGTQTYGRLGMIRVAALTLKSGLVFRIRWRDPYGSVADEAVRRVSSRLSFALAVLSQGPKK